MKIVHVSDFFQTDLGYQEYYFAKYHKKLGNKVWVVSSDRHFPYKDYSQLFEKILGPRKIGKGKFNEKGITIYRLPTLLEVKTVIYLKGLFKIMRSLKPDIVFMHNMFGITPLLIAFYKRRLKYKLIYDTHVAEFNSDFKSTLPRRLYYRLFIKKIAAPIIRKNADKVIAVGEAEKNFICKSFGLAEKSVSIGAIGVDTEMFCQNPKARKNFRKKMGFSQNDKIIIYTGKIQPEKEIDMLIKLVARLRKSKLKAKLLLVGDAGSGLKVYLEKLIEQLSVGNRVTWISTIPHHDLSKYYQIADIAIWPGNASMARFEAMSVGLPLVLADWEGTNSLVEASVALSFTRGNLEELTNKVQVLLKNKGKYKEMSKNAVKLVKNNYSWEKIAKNAINLK